MKFWKVKRIRTVMRMISQHTMMSLETIKQNLPPHIFTVSMVSIRILGWALLYNASNFEENIHDSTTVFINKSKIFSLIFNDLKNKFIV